MDSVEAHILPPSRNLMVCLNRLRKYGSCDRVQGAWDGKSDIVRDDVCGFMVTFTPTVSKTWKVRVEDDEDIFEGELAQSPYEGDAKALSEKPFALQACFLQHMRMCVGMDPPECALLCICGLGLWEATDETDDDVSDTDYVYSDETDDTDDTDDTWGEWCPANAPRWKLHRTMTK